MCKRLSETASRAGRVWSAVVLALLACLVIAGCAQRDSSSEKDRPGGFYGGVSGGMGL
jgi:hypothetical protein